MGHVRRRRVPGVARQHHPAPDWHLHPDLIGGAELDARVVVDMAENLGMSPSDVAEPLPDPLGAAPDGIGERRRCGAARGPVGQPAADGHGQERARGAEAGAPVCQADRARDHTAPIGLAAVSGCRLRPQQPADRRVRPVRPHDQVIFVTGAIGKPCLDAGAALTEALHPGRSSHGDGAALDERAQRDFAADRHTRSHSRPDDGELGDAFGVAADPAQAHPRQGPAAC